MRLTRPLALALSCRPAGRQQLDRIREQFEAQEAESKRKLDRLNGRIAELGEGKRAMWSVLGQYQAHKAAATGKAGASDAAAAEGGEATTIADPAAPLCSHSRVDARGHGSAVGQKDG